MTSTIDVLPPAEDTAATPSVLEQVRQALQEARAAGLQTPGRPALIRLTSATDYQVRQALATVTAELAATRLPLAPGRRQWRRPPAPAAFGRSGSTAARHQRAHVWPLLVIGLGAAVAVWSGWVGLGALTGFGEVQLLPGLLPAVRINTAVVLPLSVEAYGAYALHVWLNSATLAARTRNYAAVSSIASLAIGVAAQAVYHLMSAAHVTTAPPAVTVLVASVPVVVLGLATALARLVRDDATIAARRAVEQADDEQAGGL
jgi:hypothetical protein